MAEKNKQSVSIIGAGRLGGALAIALDRKNYEIKALVARRLENATLLANKISSSTKILTAENPSSLPSSEIVFVTTQDPEITFAAQSLAANRNFNSETIFLHTSGSLSSDVLKPLREKGFATGSLHPLVSVSDSVTGAECFGGAFFCIEGDAKAVETAKRLVADLEGESFEIEPEFKMLYHAAAVMTAGHLVALFDVAAETLSACGIEDFEARRILLPLARSALENLHRQTPAEALTGTFARADVETMRRHLFSLRTNKTALKVYTELGKRSIVLALKRRANADKLEEMRRELDKDEE